MNTFAARFRARRAERRTRRAFTRALGSAVVASHRDDLITATRCRRARRYDK